MRFRERLWFFWVCAAIFGIDRFSKRLVMEHMTLYESIPLIPGFFNLTYIHNRGVVFGLFADFHSTWAQNAILLISFLSFIIIIIYFLFVRHENAWVTLGFSFVLGGALGNTWDRFTQGYVVDFLDFYYGEYHWPTFNFADVFITLGIGLLVVQMFSLSRWPSSPRSQTRPASSRESESEP